jgi:predicted ATPase/uncharacterized membrane protein YiaA
MSIIKTPDQRLRVFISSTIQELSIERKKVQEAVERLKLIPVFFESGARPYPPKDLYRAYLEQSDIFIGIYWKSYGWIAPDMEISGLEDEWRLSNDKPRLIYIKKADERDDRLKTLIKDIEASNTACYQKFDTVESLSELLINDLAVLLTERFQSSEDKKTTIRLNPKTNLPILRSEIVGRTKEIKDLLEKLSLPDLGIITLVGPGGTGKTRLALEIGKKLLSDFKDGVYFVELSGITENGRLPGVIAQTMGMNNNGITDVGKWVLDYLFDKSLFLILDNFEQIVDAGIFVSEILNKCQHVKILVTSRTPLYIRNEHLFTVEPLELKIYNKAESQNRPEAVTLFMQRALESNSSLKWNEENLKAAYSICNKLDGLPLGIELAAARCRHLDPVLLDKKMENILNTLTSGPRDFPKRQQTLRNTIQWSYDLLEKTDQRLFRRLSVFENGWNSKAMETICWSSFSETEDIQKCIEHLEDFGLIVRLQSESEYIKHKFLQVIKEFAAEKLTEANEDEKIHILYCNYFEQLAQSNTQQIWLNPAIESHLTFREDYENFVGALHYAMKTKNEKKTWSLINSLNALYMITGEIGFLFEWLEKANIKSDEANIERMLKNNSKYEIALCLLSAGFTRSTTGKFQEGIRDLTISRKFAHEVGMPPIESIALLFLGIANVTIGCPEKAKELLLESITLSKQFNQLAVQITAEITMHIVYVEENNSSKAAELMEKAITDSHLNFMPLVQSYSLYQRGFLHYYMKEYDQARVRFQESISVNQKFNLNSNASFPLIGIAMVYTEFNKKEIALDGFRNALECLRLSGSNVEFECLKYALCYFLAKTGQTEDALRLFSFIKYTYKKTNFRPWLTQRVCLDQAEQVLLNTYDLDFLNLRIENAEELSNEEIYSMIN